jgi:hypothetical protein
MSNSGADYLARHRPVVGQRARLSSGPSSELVRSFVIPTAADSGWLRPAGAERNSLLADRRPLAGHTRSQSAPASSLARSSRRSAPFVLAGGGGVHHYHRRRRRRPDRGGLGENLKWQRQHEIIASHQGGPTAAGVFAPLGALEERPAANGRELA